MKKQKQQIDPTLKEIIVPLIREKGFKGSLLNFSRQQADRINLLTIQHSSYELKFAIEIANCPPHGYITPHGEIINKNEIIATQLDYRHRLGSAKYNTDYWFEYGENSAFLNTYKKVVCQIIDLWEEAEEWWATDPLEQRLLTIKPKKII